MRLTRSVRQQLLDQNEGYEDTTNSRGKNFTETRRYRISGGELHIRESGKTSWADSRYDNEYVADGEQTKRFLRENLHRLSTAGIG